MGIKVAKFGGTSLANAEQIKKVQNIIENDSNIKYVVPSAPGKRNKDDNKITDLLYLCHAHVKNEIPFDDVFKIIHDRYISIVRELGLNINIEKYLDEVKKNIENGASKDYTASRGEYLNGLIIAELLGFDFVDPADIIFFDKNGRVDMNKTISAVRSVMKKHEKAVIPGFYGTSNEDGSGEGKVKTFPRGGSDITGAIIARGVNAEIYENWTDVSGLLMADPKIVKDPKPIDTITYRELRELAYMGANVLHDEAIFPVREVGIPIKIKNTNKPEDPGTLIVQDAAPITHSGTITGVAGKKDFTVIMVEKALMNKELGYGRRLLSILEANGISFEHMPSGIDTISLVIADSELEGKLDKVIMEIKSECNPDTVEVYPNMALIATVGRGMAYTPGIAGRLFSALGNEGINVRMIDQGSSEINIIIGVEIEDFERAIRAIYKAFVK
ncbi:MAG: aspartate kinase [Spirochaetes bacterium]|nr:MAG: aspartate kinase [Spirochaetota bacterium]